MYWVNSKICRKLRLSKCRNPLIFDPWSVDESHRWIKGYFFCAFFTTFAMKTGERELSSFWKAQKCLKILAVLKKQRCLSYSRNKHAYFAQEYPATLLFWIGSPCIVQSASPLVLNFGRAPHTQARAIWTTTFCPQSQHKKKNKNYSAPVPRNHPSSRHPST